MIKFELEEWQVKNLRNYFGENSKTQTAHWAYVVFDKALKEQCNITDVVRTNIEDKHPIEGVNETMFIDDDTEEEQLPYNCDRCGEEQEVEGTCGCCEMELRERL